MAQKNENVELLAQKARKRFSSSLSPSVSFCHGACVCLCVFAIYLMLYSLWHTNTHRKTTDPQSGLIPPPSCPTTRHMGCVVCMCLALTLTQLAPWAKGDRNHWVRVGERQGGSRKKECIWVKAPSLLYMFYCPIGLHLQNSELKINLLRISI